jgi:hypothetical protein
MCPWAQLETESAVETFAEILDPMELEEDMQRTMGQRCRSIAGAGDKLNKQNQKVKVSNTYGGAYHSLRHRRSGPLYEAFDKATAEKDGFMERCIKDWGNRGSFISSPDSRARLVDIQTPR